MPGKDLLGLGGVKVLPEEVTLNRPEEMETRSHPGGAGSSREPVGQRGQEFRGKKVLGVEIGCHGA